MIPNAQDFKPTTSQTNPECMSLTSYTQDSRRLYTQILQHLPSDVSAGIGGVGNVRQDGGFQLVLCTFYFKVGDARTQPHPAYQHPQQHRGGFSSNLTQKWSFQRHSVQPIT